MNIYAHSSTSHTERKEQREREIFNRNDKPKREKEREGWTSTVPIQYKTNSNHKENKTTQINTEEIHVKSRSVHRWCYNNVYVRRIAQRASERDREKEIERQGREIGCKSTIDTAK